MLNWFLLLLLPASIVSQTAALPQLHCMNDYLYTINCSLTEVPEDASKVYWLHISERDGQTWCRMTEVDGAHFCSIHVSSLEPDADDYVEKLNDLQKFKISLCDSNDTNTCRILIERYKPHYYIKPNAPCCLNLTHNFSRHHFTWRSTYEEYSETTNFPRNLQYQLRYYTRGPGTNVSSHDLITESLSCSVGDENLLPGAEYGARLRSKPNNRSYWGVWSDWSPEFRWKTEPAEPYPQLDAVSTPLFSKLGKELLLLCVTALLLLLSFACFKMWRCAYIPTPAPYFHTLYNDYHGDFKSWVVTRDKAADGLKVEEMVQINTFTKCEDVQEEGPQPPQPIRQEATYTNIPHLGCDSLLLGVPYAVSTLAPAEDSSGCLMCSKREVEGGVSLYSNEYCTLSAFHQAQGCSRGASSERHAEYEN